MAHRREMSGGVSPIMLGVALLSGCGPSLKALSVNHVDCQESAIEISDVAGRRGEKTWIATCNDRRYVCAQVIAVEGHGDVTRKKPDVHCTLEDGYDDGNLEASRAPPTPAASSLVPAQRHTSEAPAGAAGFVLGDGLDETRARCTEKDLPWEALEPAKFECGGMPDSVGLDGQAMLSFCQQQLCGIELVLHPAASGKSYALSFTSLAEVLEKKYGSPERRETLVPSDCRDQHVLSGCVKEGRARFLRTWGWPTGERITLTLGLGSEDASLAVRVVYSRRPEGFRPKSNAL